MPRYRVTISSNSGQAMVDLVRVHRIQVLDHGNRRTKDTGYVVHAIVDAEAIQGLRADGYRVQQHDDVDETGKARQKEVGQGNRYEPDRPR